MNLSAVNQFIGQDWVYLDNDCWSVFCRASIAVFGVKIHELEIPKESSLSQNRRLFEENSTGKEWQKIDKPEPGCAVLFKNRLGKPIHIGLYIQKGNILHCPGMMKKPGRTVYEHINLLKMIYKHIEFYAYIPDNRC